MNRQAQWTERRARDRRLVSLAARIRLEWGVYVPCTVHNITAMGAGLELTYDAFVPLQFRLQIPGDLFEVECGLRHRRGTFVGVEFLSARAEALARYG
ncbi:MAG: hypothetical protein AB7O57_00725 [Hyphomicrobiaceae bacterium]